MIPTVSAQMPVAKGAQPVTNQPPQAKPDAQTQGAASTSAGESAASNVRVETRAAIDPTRQTANAPRLRDQEKSETTRNPEGPVGPPPAFQETLLQRQARTVLSPQAVSPTDTASEQVATVDAEEPSPAADEASELAKDEDAAKRAEAERGFAETRALDDDPADIQVNVLG